MTGIFSAAVKMMSGRLFACAALSGVLLAGCDKHLYAFLIGVGVRRIVALHGRRPDRQGRTKRMKPRIVPVLTLLAGLLVFGCAEKASVNEGNKDGTEPSRREVVRIVFDLPGDDIGSQEDRVLLDALREAVAASTAGEIVSSGFGMGTMELVVAIDSGESTEVLRRIVGDVSPGAKYRIVVDAPESEQSPGIADKRP